MTTQHGPSKVDFSDNTPSKEALAGKVPMPDGVDVNALPDPGVDLTNLIALGSPMANETPALELPPGCEMSVVFSDPHGNKFQSHKALLDSLAMATVHAEAADFAGMYVNGKDGAEPTARAVSRVINTITAWEQYKLDLSAVKTVVNSPGTSKEDA